MRAAVIDVQTLKFDEKGLIPAIVQDAETGKVLTLAQAEPAGPWPLPWKRADLLLVPFPAGAVA